MSLLRPCEMYLRRPPCPEITKISFNAMTKNYEAAKLHIFAEN